VETLPELGAELIGAGTVDEIRRSVEHGAQLTLGETNVKWQARLSVQDLCRVAGGQADRVQVQVGRRVEQDVVLSRRESDDFTRRDRDHAVADAEAG
jgi:hypothetical protein